MADTFDHLTRSRIMATVRSRGNRSTEGRILEAFRALSLRGWRRHYPVLGTPDFAFPAKRLAIFLDGCFWHGCARCGSIPESNKAYWVRKIRRNKARDRRNVKMLRAKGWTVLRIWEHALKDERQLRTSMKRIQKQLARET